MGGSAVSARAPRVSHPVIRCSSQVGIGIAALFMLAAACQSSPRPTAIVTLGPGFTPMTSATQVMPSVSVNLDDNRRGVDLNVGQCLSVRLGQDYDWRVSVSEPGVLEFSSTASNPEGQQALLRAVQAGETRVVADGQPACKRIQPPCTEPSRAFYVNARVRYLWHAAPRWCARSLVACGSNLTMPMRTGSHPNANRPFRSTRRSRRTSCKAMSLAPPGCTQV